MWDPADSAAFLETHDALSILASLRRDLIPWFNQRFPDILPPELFSQSIPLNHGAVHP